MQSYKHDKIACIASGKRPLFFTKTIVSSSSRTSRTKVIESQRPLLVHQRTFGLRTSTKTAGTT
ncbi:MAG: hypothetical protein MZU97_04010 [Bacillus subtilis]|nr:hypothetical protein [Bacillus subtilis]